MAEKKFILIEALTVNDLVAEMAKEVSKIYNNSKAPGIENDADKLITRQNVADIFGISLPTVHSWANTGILIAYKIGNKTRFKKSEVLQACKPIKEKI